MAIALGVAGLALSAYSAIQNGKAQKKVADTNAQQAREQEAIAIDQGNAQAEVQARTSNMAIDAIRAQYGASGIDVNSGSPLDVLQANAMRASLDNQTVRYNALVKAHGYAGEVATYGIQATAAQQRGYLAAGSDILSGSARVYGASYNSSGGGSSNAGDSIEV